MKKIKCDIVLTCSTEKNYSNAEIVFGLAVDELRKIGFKVNPKRKKFQRYKNGSCIMCREARVKGSSELKGELWAILKKYGIAVY